MRAIIPKHGFRILDYTISLGLFFNTSLECVREGDRCRGDGCTLTIRVRKMRPNYGGREWIKFEALIYIFLLGHPNKVLVAKRQDKSRIKPSTDTNSGP
jgi:hypothetical protein